MVKAHKLRGCLERVANYLLAQSARQGDPHHIVLPYGKRVLASLLGMTPENLSRAFAQLADYGVQVRGPEIHLARPRALERLARPSPLIDNHVKAGPLPIGRAGTESLTTTPGAPPPPAPSGVSAAPRTA